MAKEVAGIIKLQIKVARLIRHHRLDQHWVQRGKHYAVLQGIQCPYAGACR
jgi:hypothetical protein